MMVITPDRPVCTLAAVFDIAPGRFDEIIRTSTTEVDRTVRHLPGFLGAAAYVRIPEGIGGDAESRNPALEHRRLVEYIQWRTVADFDAFRRGPESAYVHRVRELATTSGFGSYTVRATFGPGAATIDSADHGVTVIATAPTPPTTPTASPDGLDFAAVHQGRSDWLLLSRWRSTDDFVAAYPWQGHDQADFGVFRLEHLHSA